VCVNAIYYHSLFIHAIAAASVPFIVEMIGIYCVGGEESSFSLSLSFTLKHKLLHNAQRMDFVYARSDNVLLYDVLTSAGKV
jgi:hypothetical protein